MSNQGQAANSIPFSDSDSDHEESSNGGLPVLPQVETGDKPHSRFFLPDDFIILKVEATLFRVPGFILKDHSTKLRGFLATQPATTLKPEAPITLEDIRAVDFEHFLSVLLPRDIGQSDLSSLDEWTSVLKVAHKWDYPSVRKLAISQIAPLASAVDKVVLGHKYDVPEWVSDGYIELCQREASVSAEEGHRLGVDDVVHISNIRFQLISTQTGARLQAGNLLRLCFGPKRHLLGTNRVISFIGKAKRSSSADSGSPPLNATPRKTSTQQNAVPAVKPSADTANNMYTSSDGDFFAWLAKKKHSRQPLESLIFEKPTSNLDTFVKEMDAAHLTDISYFPNSVREANDTVLYFSISCLPRYDAYSSEELRLYDYLQGRTMALCPPPVEIPPLKDSVMAESGIDRVSLFNFV